MGNIYHAYFIPAAAWKQWALRKNPFGIVDTPRAYIYLAHIWDRGKGRDEGRNEIAKNGYMTTHQIIVDDTSPFYHTT